MSHDTPPELLPCPFCGTAPVEDRIEPHKHYIAQMPDYPGSWSIECVKCEFRIFDHDARENAVRKWNTRQTRSEIEPNAQELERISRARAAAERILNEKPAPGYGHHPADYCEVAWALLATPFPPSATGLSALERFALSILESHRNDGYPGDIDGGFVQEEAVRCGVLVEKEVNGPCNSETCSCAEVAEFPTTCYFLSDEVEAKRDALAAIDSRSSNA